MCIRDRVSTQSTWGISKNLKLACEKMKFQVVAILLLAIAGAHAATQIDVFLESLCPYSRDFVWKSFGALVSAIKETKDTALYNEFQFNLHFWGNANEQKNGKVKCQHGELECLGNQYLECGLELLSQQAGFDYAICMTHYVGRFGEDSEKCSKYCSAQIKANHDELTTCAKGKQGKKLHLEAGTATEDADRTKNYVPYVVVDGEHESHVEHEIIRNALAWVCEQRGSEEGACKPSIVEKYAPARKMRMGGGFGRTFGSKKLLDSLLAKLGQETCMTSLMPLRNKTKKGSSIPFYISKSFSQLLHIDVSGYQQLDSFVMLDIVDDGIPVSYTHLRAHETDSYLVCRLLLEKKKNKTLSRQANAQASKQ
eukprot:TRINITY_DN722_c0_g1_i2.p1 TRINITY_DN722_c0_g1~~TRINITY_DN722_c0_g1_i2.p1  ORF type:complete len:368 (+),score=117.36 TRINITY_DN722_c0_g1_i2:80-1183(+)